MSQFDFGTIDPNVKTGTQSAADLNQWRTALHSTHAGAARPAYAAPGMLWVDQVGAQDWRLKLATASGDTIIGGVNPFTNTAAYPVTGGATFQIRGANANTAPGVELVANTPGGGGLARINMVASSYTAGAEQAIIRFGIARNAPAGDSDFIMGQNTSAQPQLTVNGGYDGTMAGYDQAPLIAKSAALSAGLVLNNSGQVVWTIACSRASGTNLWFGTSGASGPTGLGGWSMGLQANGAMYARAFNVATFAATNVRPLTGALTDVVKLRGVRCFNTETEREDLRLEVDDVEAAFPEALSDAPEGKAINYMALAAPIIEAIRELDARLTTLEGTPA